MAERTVMIVDDDSGFRAYTADLLESVGHRTVELADGEHVVSAVAEHEPELVILDVQLPGRNGYEVCRELRDRYGDTISIVFVSGERMDSIDRAAGFLVGGDDYLVKPVDAGELIARVRRLLERRPENGGAPSADSRLLSLTPREREILDLLAEGYRQDEIAQRLVISSKTVATHIQRVLTKLDVRSRAQAVGVVLRNERSPDVVGHLIV